ncbi:tetratricopeptide repeat protein [Rhodohalobacter sp. 614A]|uniref:tetratricopeptide repeat protein n=1 Tax=Rhodohalobacter sp. 614A TaxID=2908649 RepID=UPI001F4898C5|nr:tetratricopeptide repeat protein [Rhodohalobacter sp. 614A]
MKNNNQKIRELAESLKKNPDDSFTKFALALELLKKDDVTKAKVLFESVLEQDPDYLGVYYHLGKLYERQSRFEEAKKLFTDGYKVAKEQQNERTALELKDALESLNFESNDDSTL